MTRNVVQRCRRRALERDLLSALPLLTSFVHARQTGNGGESVPSAATDARDPLAETTQVGPLVSARQGDRVEGDIAKGKAEGARLTVGGGGPDGLDHGWLVEPTVSADVDNKYTITGKKPSARCCR